MHASTHIAVDGARSDCGYTVANTNHEEQYPEDTKPLAIIGKGEWLLCICFTETPLFQGFLYVKVGSWLQVRSKLAMWSKAGVGVRCLWQTDRPWSTTG